MNRIKVLIIALLPLFGFSQKMKVQTAWRALNDYDATVKNGKPDISYLDKANEAIDLAIQHEDTKKQGKVYAYKARIMYGYYQNKLVQEMAKLEATEPDKKKRMDLAYGNVPTDDYVAANDALDKIQTVDPDYMKMIQDGLMTGTSSLSSDDMKFLATASLMKMEAGNIANGKYAAGKYGEAADYFYKLAFLNQTLTKKVDTANFYNAAVCAAKAKDNAKIIDYNKRMIDTKIASPYNFQAIYTAYLIKGDSAKALQMLKKGRSAHPGDMGLLNTETTYYLQTGKRDEALNNLNTSIEKDPSNGLFYLVRATIYDKIANPKDDKGRDTDKPQGFETEFKKAEDDYTKAIELNKDNNDNLFNSYYNFGAMYNNYGGYIQSKANDLPLAEAAKKGKAMEADAQANYKKAIPLLEKALEVNPSDKATMSALRKLYLLTGDSKKAADMQTKLSGSK